jgi:hypothetical protein
MMLFRAIDWLQEAAADVGSQDEAARERQKAQ